MHRRAHAAMRGCWGTYNTRAAPRARPVRSRAAHCANGTRAGRVEVVDVGADLDESARGIDARGAGDGASALEPPSCDKNTHTPRSAHEPRAHAARARGRGRETGVARLTSRRCRCSAHLRASPRAGASNAPRKPNRLSTRRARSAAQNGPCEHAISRRRQWAPTRMPDRCTCALHRQ